MSKFKAFIKNHRTSIHAFFFFSLLFSSFYFLYSSKDAILSLSEYDFFSIGFGAILLHDSADFFMKFLDDFKEKRKEKNNRIS